MSYNLIFLKCKPNLDNIDEFLKNDKLLGESFHIENTVELSKNLKLLGRRLINHLQNGNTFEMIYSNFQLSVLNNQICLNIPYWKENLDKIVQNEILEIINFLINEGFYGYDSQTKEIIEQKNHDFYNKFKMMFRTLYPNMVDANHPFSEQQTDNAINRSQTKEYLLRRRDYILKKVELLQKEYNDKKLNYSPESLKDLEFIYWDYVDNSKFQLSSITKSEFNELLSYYKAAVYVKNKKFVWSIHTVYSNEYCLSIQTRNGGYRIILGKMNYLEKFPDKKKQKLYKEYKANI